VASNVAEGLVKKGWEVTLFATGDSQTAGQLASLVPLGYEEDSRVDAKVAECLHISHLMERASEFDLIHNHFDFLPLTYTPLIQTPMVTTIHGFSSEKIVPVYERFNATNRYVSISDADRRPSLRYIATVYNGIRIEDFTFSDRPDPSDYLLFLGRIHPDKGTWEAIQIARKAGMRLLIAGIIQDRAYFDEKVAPYLDNVQTEYLGPAGPRLRDELLGRAAGLLHPVLFAEPFGMSVAEAMMCGTPVLAFSRGSMSELVREGETGFLVGSVDEAVNKVKDLDQLDRSFCRAWAVERFSQQRMIEDYIKVYYQTLNMNIG
jgi:glycosyltransferase involved in cell wall biosynthesis